jgi:tRNA-dihydrouridine synthase
MMDAFERFGLLINDRVVKTPVALASMAGIVDAAYVLDRKDHVGIAFMGGFSIDAPALEAARQMAAGGERKEFLYDDPAAELQAQIDALKTTHVIPAINLRGSAPDAFASLARQLGDSVVYEIDAHCRQPAMVAAGWG